MEKNKRTGTGDRLFLPDRIKNRRPAYQSGSTGRRRSRWRSGHQTGNIASLLGDIAGIQTQQTSAATGSTEMRVQGLPGKIHNCWKMECLCFGGYAGSFSILQIPPLDLKQIEIVKEPVPLYMEVGHCRYDQFDFQTAERRRVWKQSCWTKSSLKESNVNVYLSNRKNKNRFTFLPVLLFSNQWM